MNEITIEKSTSVSTRTPELIVAEINNIKEQTRKMVLYNSIEIGKRLVEAKSMVSHGSWGGWLKENVDYSQRTANNLMKIYQEYGSEQFLSIQENSHAFANLNYSKAVELLGVPREEREEFAKENDINSMSTRKLKEAIREKNEALKEKKEIEKKLKETVKEAARNKELLDKVSDSYDRLEKTNHKHFTRAEKLKKEMDSIKEQIKDAEKSQDNGKVEKLQNQLIEYTQKIEELEKQIKEVPIEVVGTTIVEKVPEEVEKELEELRKKVNLPNSQSTITFKVYFDEVVRNFNNLLTALEDIKESDPDEYDKYNNAVSLLKNKMLERL